ncbi:MAG: gamma-glutamyltransferase family protein, partial [Planctomycetota bacterium]|nr:gamma-glutamyltransferase family protein [Planctomycetota bacterium]
FVQLELGKTLSRIAEQGPDGFYRGETADLIVAEMNRGNGQITRKDLESYRAIWRKPVHGTYRGRDVYSMCPPSSGGIAVVQILNMLEGFSLPAHNSANYLHLLAEIEKQVFADRSVHLGDSDFVPVPAFLTSKKYAQKRAAHISIDRKTSPKSISHGRGESEETTHFSVVDRWGNGVSNTTTLNGSFGSGIVVEGAGFLLNNEMDDFSSKPGVPNMFGVTGGEANAIASGKRMLSSMSPTLVFQEGKLWLILGSPGGPTIITTVAQVILNRIEHGMTLPEAVAAPRFHHQWPPRESGDDSIRIEKAIDVESLEHWYTFEVRRIGDVQAIEIDGPGVIGAPDPRGTGTVVYE